MDASHMLAPVAGEMAKREGRWLLEKASGCDGAALMAALGDIPAPTEAEAFRALVHRRASGEPLQYVLGEAPFLRRMFHVGPGVLIPRPETEMLAVRALGGLASRPGPAAVLDVGTGSGCLAVTLAAERPHTRVEAWDVSMEALAYARMNANRHGVDIRFRQQDMLETGGLDAAAAEGSDAPVVSPAFDLVVSNPPYIHRSEGASLQSSVVDFEPDIALFASGDALLFYRALVRLGRRFLRCGGRLLVEIHADRGQDVVALFEDAGYVEIVCLQDQFGRDRIVEARVDGSVRDADPLSRNQTGR